MRCRRIRSDTQMIILQNIGASFINTSFILKKLHVHIYGNTELTTTLVAMNVNLLNLLPTL